jgi:tetratricopeptide (TPR) repeat protein
MIGAFLLTGIDYALTKGEQIPITTSSDKALEYYLKGRDLADKLRGQESLQFFEKAVSEDADFALGYLYLSFAQPTAKGFFEMLDRAVSLVENVSEGERLWILGFQAGINGLPMEQKDYYQNLVSTYPEDARAHNLLGNFYFGQQKYALSILEFEKATELAPEFSQPYNQLGYAHRFLENYSEAENAFKKYIDLIPDDPNPYDSYAELLMKMGRFDESIDSYRKALAVNNNFVASHIGIATNLNFKANHKEARKHLKKLYEIARNDGERRAAHFAATVSYADEGRLDKALEEQYKQYALAEKINDSAAMAGDLIVMGNILLEAGKADEALPKYEQAIELVEKSDLSREVKDNAKRIYLFNVARVALSKGDFSAARAKTEEFGARVEAINNTNQIRLYHQLEGMIALEEKNYDRALEELKQANQQNPYNIYRMALAYEAKGDKRRATVSCMKAANFYGLNNLNYAFSRTKAMKLLDSI